MDTPAETSYLTQARLGVWANSLTPRDMTIFLQTVGIAALRGASIDPAVHPIIEAQVPLDTEEVAFRQGLLQSYASFAPVVAAIRAAKGKLPDRVEHLGGNLSDAYLYTDPSGNKHVIKLIKEWPDDPHRKILTLEGSIGALVRARDHDHIENITAASYADSAFVTSYVPEASVETLSYDDLKAIPRQRIRDLASILQEAHRLRVRPDFIGEHNLRYGPARGYILLDPFGTHIFTDKKQELAATINDATRCLIRGHSTPAEAAVLARICEEFAIAWNNPQLIGATILPRVLQRLQETARGLAISPWPEEPLSLSAAYQPAAPVLSANVSIGNVGNELVATLETIRIPSLRAALLQLSEALTHLLSLRAESPLLENTYTSILEGQGNIARATAQLTEAHMSIETYLAAVGLERLIPRLE